jgi:hypothetical protein
MAAKEKKAAAAAPKKTRSTTSTRAKTGTASAVTEEMIAERAYHISQSGEGSSDVENWLRAEAELRSA